MDERIDEAVEEVAAGVEDKGWVVRESFLSREEVEALAADCRRLWEEGEFRRAGVGHGSSLQVRTEVRSDYVLWLSDEVTSPRLEKYLARVEALRQALNRRLYLGLFDFEAHLTVYPAGAFYAKHLDRFRSVAYRTVSVILYLNRDWREEEGGTLRIFLDSEDGDGSEAGPTVDVAPRGGTLVAFLSDRFYHEVLPATRERLSVTGWLKVRT